MAADAKRLSSCGNCAVVFCASGSAFDVLVAEMMAMTLSGAIGESSSVFREALSTCATIVVRPVIVYPFILNSRPNGVSCGKPLWQAVHASFVCREKLGTRNLDTNALNSAGEVVRASGPGFGAGVPVRDVTVASAATATPIVIMAAS